MATKYFRITAYYPQEDISFIMDSNGMFEKLWQFSAYIVSKGCKILEVGTDETFLDINIEKAERITDKVILRASCQGKPKESNNKINDINYRIIGINSNKYIPDKYNTL
ncbi:hypothetical protein EOM82_09125 [bacterium]|nr:hypothetical protein [bacterium]